MLTFSANSRQELCSWKIAAASSRWPADSIVSFAQPMVATVIIGAKSMD
jgi:hypothetical protein